MHISYIHNYKGMCTFHLFMDLLVSSHHRRLKNYRTGLGVYYTILSLSLYIYIFILYYTILYSYTIRNLTYEAVECVDNWPEYARPQHLWTNILMFGVWDFELEVQSMKDCVDLYGRTRFEHLYGPFQTISYPRRRRPLWPN